MSSPMRRGLTQIMSFVIHLPPCEVEMSSPMRRGLTQSGSAHIVKSDGIRVEMSSPMRRGLTQCVHSVEVSSEFPSRNEFPDEKGIDTSSLL